MYELPVGVLSIILVALILISGFFSAAEIGMMAINRYRLKHLTRERHRLAMLVTKLLERPDRLLGVILIGNNLANIMASAVTTLIVSQKYGDLGVAISTFVLTFVILVFAEVAPKIYAASHQQQVSFFAAIPLVILQKIFYPVVMLVNFFAQGLLRLFRVRIKTSKAEYLSGEELRTVVYEASGIIPQQHRDMLLSIFDLEQMTVNDIMVPRNEIIGINLDDDWDEICQQLKNSQHTRLPIYHDSIDNVLGILHLRSALGLLALDEPQKEKLIEAAEKVLWAPENTPLHKQLLNFRQHKTRIGLVVNEYGDIQGLITLEDILEEIVGEFTTDIAASTELVHPQADGSFLIDGSSLIRELNRDYNWELPSEGPKTLSGLIIEHLQDIPEPGVCLLIEGYPIEIVRVKDNMVKTALIFPQKRKTEATFEE